MVVSNEQPGDDSSPSEGPSGDGSSSWASWGAWGQSWIDTVVETSASTMANTMEIVIEKSAQTVEIVKEKSAQTVEIVKEKSAQTVEIVKEKSAQTVEMVKKDFNEFVDVIQSDTSDVMSETAAKIDPGSEEQLEEGKNEVAAGTASFDSLESATKVVRKGMASLLSSVSDLIAIPPDDSHDEELTIMSGDTPTHYNRKEQKLRALQTDSATYCNEPHDDAMFREWLGTFELDSKKHEMSNMLVANPAVRGVYTQLVPAVVSHTTFWQRYFYKVHVVECEEKRRDDIVARANTEKDDDADEVGSGWGDDDDEDDGIVTIGDVLNNDENNDDNNEELDVVSESTTITDVSQPQCSTVESTADELQNEIENKCESSTSNEPIDERCADTTKTKTTATTTTTESCSKPLEPLHIDQPPIEAEPLEINVADKVRLRSPVLQSLSLDHETSSVGSWVSIDDEIKVKAIKGEVDATTGECEREGNDSTGNLSSDSTGVLVNKSDLLDSDDEDFDLDDDVNEEDVAKMVNEIKNGGGNLDDDEDWEKWE